ncbi:sugar phosphate isomerase/epimerase family protein [Tunicatimonas pelagia]|uniref:sugar phosphate isomerase/epimerase family protein n=1 Tax=Tunicatimonas pelagia TaxID=931531 RepID=UPI0026663BB1|nr:sugar phosphate isomerase/epimerase [Tunicatimonas pelagia]WKN42084.1 sugar phosphate isomerase/epimerase [Tunicatimonas pelagia]
MAARRTFIKQAVSTTAGIALGSSTALGAASASPESPPQQRVSLPENPLVLFDNFHTGNRASYSWKSKFAAAKQAGFNGFEFVLVDPETDRWKEAMDLFWKSDFNVWGFHWTTQAVIDDKATEIDEEIDKIVQNVELLAKMPIKPYFSLSLSGRGELSGPTIAESGSALAEDRHWQRAYKIISAFDRACTEHNITGALYPHTHWLCDTPQSAFKILEGAEAQTVGSAFCSHHWYANSASSELDEVLQHPLMKRLPYVVLTNGIFTPAKFSAVRFDEGQIDMAWLLAKIYEFGYSGPISSQGWNIKGDPFISCKAFVDTIQSLRTRFSEHPQLNPLYE